MVPNETVTTNIDSEKKNDSSCSVFNYDLSFMVAVEKNNNKKQKTKKTKKKQSLSYLYVHLCMYDIY